MTTYTMTLEGLAVMKRRGIRRAVLLYGSFGIVGLAFMNRGDFSFAGLAGLLAGGITMVLLLTLLIWRGVQALPKEWQHFELIIDDDTVTRKHHRLGELTLHRNDIAQIIDYPHTGLQVRTADRKQTIFIPIDLENYAAVHAQLATWKPFTRTPLGMLGRYALIFAIWLVVFGFLLLVDVIPVIIAAGVVTMGLSLWSLYAMWKQKLLSPWSVTMLVLGNMLILLVVVLRINRITGL